jgi:hypothetical protein
MDGEASGRPALPLFSQTNNLKLGLQQFYRVGLVKRMRVISLVGSVAT